MIALVHTDYNGNISATTDACSSILVYSSVTANAGNTLILNVKGFSQQGHVPTAVSIAMNSPVAGLTWHQAGSIISSPKGWMACFYAANTPAFIATGANYAIVTVTIDNGGGNLLAANASSFEYSGLNISAPYDTQSAGNSGSGSIPDAGSIVPASGGELVVLSVIEWVPGLYSPPTQVSTGNYLAGSAGSTHLTEYSALWLDAYNTSCPAGAQVPAFLLNSGTLGGQDVAWAAAAWAFSS